MYKFSTKVAGETHLRTFVKAASYRVMSVLVTIGLTFLLGGTWTQALTMGTISLVIGALHYYLYDRLWLFIPWHRDSEGKDTVTRSVVKSIIYRITAIIITAALARVVFADTTMVAFLLASLKFVANAIGYFFIERLFNWISWGRR